MYPRRRMAAIACLAVAAIGHASASRAGIADTPLPHFADGTQSRFVQAITGVIKRTRLQTDFICSSFASTPVNIGVEIFDPAGLLMNDIGAGSGALLNVTPGQTVTIGTSATLALLESAVIPLTSVSQGSARIIATDDRVRCTVLVLDDAVVPPVALATLSDGVRPVAESLLPSAPLPRFGDGQPATHAVLIPGVVKRVRMQTDFFCTSLAAENIDVGVEVYGPDGTLENRIADGNGAALNVRPGATVTLGTTGTAALLETSVISTRGVAQGFARVVSTSGQVACTAMVLDSLGTPPASMSNLTGGPAAPGDVNRDGVVNAADLPALISGTFR